MSVNPLFKRFYWLFSYLGVMTVSAAFITGFRHDSEAPIANLYYNLVLYAIFIVVHMVMTMPVFKQMVFGKAEGNPTERRIYVTISVVSWVGMFILHKPIPGFAFESPDWLKFIGLCMVLLSVMGFFEFATFERLGSLLGLPGAPLSHTVGAETPLMMDGPYASVRHPMYRAAFFLTFCSLVIYPNSAQLLFAGLTAASFLGFIPFEEHQLLKARGDDYRAYMKATPYRAFRGVW